MELYQLRGIVMRRRWSTHQQMNGVREVRGARNASQLRGIAISRRGSTFQEGKGHRARGTDGTFSWAK